MDGAYRLTVDENIPLAREAFGAFGQVALAPGRSVGRAHLMQTDALLVRSVTRVDRALLDGTPVRFVGSATIGTDHVDLDYLRAAGIAFAHAPGSNAGSVVEYVVAALLRLAARDGAELAGRTVGIVGCGNIGRRLAERLPALGCTVLKNDPPLARQAEAEGRAHDFVGLDEVLEQADVVTLHVPLTHSPPDPTHHLVGAPELARMRPGAWLVNTCRGAVVANGALRAALGRAGLGAAVLDVWEGEPSPDAALLDRVDLATPHIAGYSHDGKVGGTVMLYHALARHLGRTPDWDAATAFAPGPDDRLALAPPAADLAPTAWLDALVRQMYDLEADDARMRLLAERPPEARGAYFTGLRKAYPRRRAFERHALPDEAIPEPLRRAVRDGLRVGPFTEP